MKLPVWLRWRWWLWYYPSSRGGTYLTVMGHGFHFPNWDASMSNTKAAILGIVMLVVVVLVVTGFVYVIVHAPDVSLPPCGACAK